MTVLSEKTIGESLKRGAIMNEEHFFKRLREKGGWIFGRGDVILEYWAAYNMYNYLNEPRHLLEAFEYKDFEKHCTKPYQGSGGLCPRSNNLISFRPEGDNLKICKGEDRYGKFLYAELIKPTVERKKFFNKFQQHDSSKYNITYTTKAKISNGVQKDWKSASGDLYEEGEIKNKYLGNVRQFIVRRACKYLLYYIVANKEKIHYALDGLDIKTIVDREHRDLPSLSDRRGNREKRPAKVPVCTSEVREIFRNWGFFKDEITFYMNLNETVAPWLRSDINKEELATWVRYAMKRVRKGGGGRGTEGIKGGPENMTMEELRKKLLECFSKLREWKK